MSLLGIDVGSSSCKAVAFDIKGNILAKSILDYWPDTNGIFSEMDADIFWKSVIKVVGDVSKKLKKDEIEALSISSQGETFICVDKAGNCVCPAIMNSDNRAKGEVDLLNKIFNKEKIYRISGAPLHPMFPLAKILWLKKNKPDIYERTKYFLSAGDYILYKMGFGTISDYSLSSRTQLFDVNKRSWSDEILENVGFDKKKLPDTYQAGIKVDKLNKEIAEILNLKPGVVVGLGGHDQPCGALGAGVINHRNIVDSAGTYECLAVSSDNPNLSLDSRKYNLNSYCHVVENKYITLAFSPGGVMVKWFIDNFFNAEKNRASKENTNLYKYLEKRIPDDPTGICITPHIIGSINPNWNPYATTTISGITLKANKYNLYKAIFEGISFELNLNIKVLESLVGNFDFIYITGGGSGSKKWVKLRADITGKRFKTLKNKESVCLGAAILAGLAAKKFKSVKEAIKELVKVNEEFLPDIDSFKEYDIQKKQYKLIYPSLEEYRKVRKGETSN